MGRDYHEETDRVFPQEVRKQTNSSDVSEEIISAAWDKMQKGAARKGHALTDAAELCSEV